MKIEKIIINGNTRLALGGKKYIEVTPTRDFQLIVGTNSSGKSSLLYECSPLPPNPNDYEKGGYKYILSEHNGNRYECRSDFGDSNKHSFMRNGVELNPGKTITVQKELVKQEFGLTPEVHALLTDQLLFTEMSPTARRYWISLFCPTDLTYANNLFNMFKSRARDTVGAIKHLSNRLSVETNKLLEFEDIEKLEVRARGIREELNIMMESRESGLPGMWEEEQQFSDNLQKLESLSRQILDMKVIPPSDIPLPQDHELRHVDEAISELRQDIGIKESLLAHHNTEYSELDSILNTLHATGTTGTDELEQRLNDLDDDEAHAMGNILRFLIEENPEDARDDSRVAIETVTTIFDALPKDKDITLTPMEYNTLRTDIDNCRFNIDKLENHKRIMEHRLDHIRQAKDIECPKCTYKWKEGVTGNEEAVLVERIENGVAEIKHLQVTLKNLEEHFAYCEEIANCFRRFKQTAASYPRLSPLWDFITNNNLLSTPAEASLVAMQWANDIHTSCTIHAIRKERNSLREALEHARRLSQNDNGMFTDRVRSLQDHIETTTTALQVLRGQMQRLREYHETLKRLATLKGEIIRLVTRIEESTIMLQRIIRNDMLGDYIGKNQTTLALLQTTLNEKNTIEGIVKDLQESHDKLIIEREAYQTLVDMLSPTEGIIAEQLMGAIHAITTNMNQTISHIWTYDLVIQDCGTESGELDYKFPIMVESPETIREDVKQGSASVTDVINFAFKLLAYDYLKLENFPLYLDEFGRTFDPEHLKRGMAFIQDCLEGKTYSQIFMISHAENYYDSFQNAEVLLLHAGNVVLPFEHNMHVVIA